MTYVVGIDLGTTNCACAYARVDGSEGAAIRAFEIDQVVGEGIVEAKPTLPSFLLIPSPMHVNKEAIQLPWDRPPFAVGTYARDRGAELPARVVASAKSWLSHAGVDRTAAILPWRGSEGDNDDNSDRLSAVNVSARYLAHIRAAWDHRMDEPLADQVIYVTVPASFDAVARELTVQAANAAGLPEITLLEEPMAAFYAWLENSGDDWRDQLTPGDVVLVCDIGGGTTDFSLIAVTDDGSGVLDLERVAVGDHILLGGDNIDLALAHGLAEKLSSGGNKLSSKQYISLVHTCRRAKESVLGEDAPDSVPIAVLGGGSKLIGGTLRTELSQADARAQIVDGFFPEVGRDAAPKRSRALGLRELGLPYATDPAVTRHLAAFLAKHDRVPTAILWNGGVMQSAALRDRVAHVIDGWFEDVDVRQLESRSLDLAVAHGAAYFGLAKLGRGIRIRGGTARSYYIGVETAMPAIPGFAPPVKALCVAPFGMEEGSGVDIGAAELGFVVGERTQFRFFAATDRQDDRAGAVVDPDSLVELPPVETELSAVGDLRAGDVVPVTLSSLVTDVGTLELWGAASEGDGRWKLEYSVRGDQS